MNDAELIALAALVNLEAVQQAGENQSREHQGEHPAYMVGSGGWYAGPLHDELVRRGAVEDFPKPKKEDTNAE